MVTFRLKRSFASVLLCLLLPAAGVSALAHTSGAPVAASSTITAPATQAAFHQDMQRMRAQMTRLHATHDPAARSKLLDAHMRTMQDTMHMMMGSSGMNGTGGMGTGMMKGQDRDRTGGMMANGRMMQMMMDQMMQHQQAMQDLRCGE